MSYTLRFSPQFRKDLRHIDPPFARRVFEVLKKFQGNPYQGKKLAGVAIGRWRLRIGGYRIRYDIEDQNTVFLYRIRKRDEIYRTRR